IVEGTEASPERLGLDYVDVIFAYRPDLTVPVDQVVRALSWVIEKGWVRLVQPLSAPACTSSKANLISCTAGTDARHRSILHRERPEEGYTRSLYKRYDLGTTGWSALMRGPLTGKPHPGGGSPEDQESKALTEPAEKGRRLSFSVIPCVIGAEADIHVTASQLALASVAKLPAKGTVILGAAEPEQLLKVIPKFPPEISEKVLQNRFALTVRTNYHPESTHGNELLSHSLPGMPCTLL
ncbi:uncharacterized protein PHACADRAFT_84712, partial [Phanerochaete carnosa HHB-10118-sp]